MTTYPVSFAEMAGEELPSTLRQQRDGTVRLARSLQDLVIRLETAVAEVRKLHARDGHGNCWECGAWVAPHAVPWPCPTRLAIDPGLEPPR